MDLEARYEFLEKVGEGSFAGVYRARDRELGREVAIKQIHAQYLSDPKLLHRFWQEAQLLASLHHPNIVTIFDIHRDRGWLILELMQGNLAERIQGRPMDLRAVRTTLAHALRALKYLHARGIIHGDVKPGNLMLDLRKRVKLGDFGLARRASDEDGSLLKGTTKYMAPETVSEDFGDVGPASDLYSLGFAAYELMCGPHFEGLFPGLNAFGRNKQIAWMMWHAAPDRRLPEIHRVLEGVPDDLARVIQTLCEKDPNRRYQSADEALSDLGIDIRIVRKADDSNVATAPALHDSTRRKRRLLAAGVCGISLSTSLAVLLWPEGAANRAAPQPARMGIVRAVSLDDHTIKIEDVARGFADEVDVGRQPVLIRRATREPMVLRELQPGDRIEFAPRPADVSASSTMYVSRPVASRGTIRAVDAARRRLVIAVEEGQTRDELPLDVPERAEILLNGEPVPLGDLQAGDRIGVRHLDARDGTGRIADSLNVRRLSEAIGFVAGVVADRRRITIRFGRSGAARAVALSLAETGEIRLAGGDRLAVGDLREGDRVRVWYDTEFHEILVTRDQQTISGTIQTIDSDRGEFIVQTPDGHDVVILVDEWVAQAGDVTLDGASVSLDELRKFDTVEVTGNIAGGERIAAGTVDARRPVNCSTPSHCR